MSIRSQGKILHFFSTASKSVDSESTSPVGEDLLTGPDADTDSESESETGECEASACPGSVETSSSTSTNRACKCQACTDICTPHHPVEVDSSKRSQLYCIKQSGKQKSHSRTIQSAWYSAYPWISVCTTQYKVYCATCRTANHQGLLNPKPTMSPFVYNGFNNWKKAREKFHEHENSSIHKDASYKLAAKERGIGIDAQLSSQLRKDQDHHRSMLMKLLHAIQFLCRQGLPLRGHKEDLESFNGNLYQLLLLQAKECPEMIPWLKRKEYISPEIVNEIITAMGQQVLRTILSEVRVSLWYSVIVDEATDVCHNEQMSFC